MRDVTPGTWTGVASRAGFVSQRLGQRRPFEAGVALVLPPGERAMADFALLRGAVIAGRVFDEFGDPVAGARVQALRSRFEHGRRHLTPTGIVDQTDDTGAFRLYGLAPGDYYVGASTRTTSADGSELSSPATSTYFPGTPIVAPAQRIRLDAGVEQSIFFGLTPARGTARVSGVLVNSVGVPLENVRISLVNGSGLSLVGSFGIFGMTRSGGTFTFLNVIPGTYNLVAHSMGDQTNALEEMFLTITVGDSDVTGITAATRRGAALTASIISEGGSTLPVLTGVILKARSTSAMAAELRAAVAPDAAGSFRLGGPGFPGLSGTWTFELEGLPEPWALKSIEVNGVDVSDTPPDFTGLGPTATARLVLTDRVTMLEGVVADRGVAADGASVVIFPDDRAKWTYPSRYLRVVRTDRQGRFRISGLPPDARYLAAAVEYTEDGEGDDPDFLQRLSNRATPFSLSEGERRTLALSLVER